MSTSRYRGAGHEYTKARAQLKARRLDCWICREPINYAAPAGHPDAFEADHYRPLSTHPHLASEPSNLRAAHSRCNRSRGATAAPEGRWRRTEL